MTHIPSHVSNGKELPQKNARAWDCRVNSEGSAERYLSATETVALIFTRTPPLAHTIVQRIPSQKHRLHQRQRTITFFMN